MGQQKLAFVIGGAQKSGTTTLDTILRYHPAIQMASVKETHFFDDEERDWKSPAYDLLDSYFTGYDNRLRGEATPITMYWRPAVRRLYDYNPEIRFVLILRNPVTRAFSNWQHEYSHARERMAFAEAIRSGRCRVRSQGTPEGLHRSFAYVERGLYGQQLRYLLEFFPQSQIHCEINEELFCDRPAGLARIAAFLGIEPFPWEMPHVHLNIAKSLAYPSLVSEEDVQYLSAIFWPEIEDVEEFLGRQVPCWRI